jgi:hypothetical protein
MLSLNSAITELKLALQGEKLEEATTLDRSVFDEAVHAEYDAFKDFFGGDFLSAYNSKQGVQISGPTICLDMVTNKPCVLVQGRVVPVKPKNITVSSESSLSLVEETADPEEPNYWDLALFAAKAEGFEGVASQAALSRDAGSVLIPAGNRVKGAAGALTHLYLETVPEKNDRKSYTRLVARIGDYQVFLGFDVSAELVAQLTAEIGQQATLANQLLTAGKVTLFTGGVLDFESVPEGSYEILGIRYNPVKTKKGSIWNVPIVITQSFECRVSDSMAKTIAGFGGSTKLRIVSLGGIVSLKTSEADAERVKARFSGKLKLKASEVTK